MALKIAPLAMFDIDNTFQFAVEHRVGGNRWTLSEEFGYGTAAGNFWTNVLGTTRSGFRENFRVKIEARRYKNAFTGKYVAYELLFKQINDKAERMIGRECENGCNYYEEVNYPINKYVVGASAKIGYQIRIRNELKKNTNFVFDFYVGAGVKRIIVNHHDPNENLQGDINMYTDYYYNDGLFSNSGLGYRDAKYNLFHLALGLKIGYLVF